MGARSLAPSRCQRLESLRRKADLPRRVPGILFRPYSVFMEASLFDVGAEQIDVALHLRQEFAH